MVEVGQGFYASIPQHVGRRFAQTVAVADIREGRSRVGMAGEVLQVNNVASLLASRGQGS
jgi:uncharacterized UPF0146 family protein